MLALGRCGMGYGGHDAIPADLTVDRPCCCGALGSTIPGPLEAATVQWPRPPSFATCMAERRGHDGILLRTLAHRQGRSAHRRLARCRSLHSEMDRNGS